MFAPFTRTREGANLRRSKPVTQPSSQVISVTTLTHFCLLPPLMTLLLVLCPASRHGSRIGLASISNRRVFVLGQSQVRLMAGVCNAMGLELRNSFDPANDTLQEGDFVLPIKVRDGVAAIPRLPD
jgi:hypothetical protein